MGTTPCLALEAVLGHPAGWEGQEMAHMRNDPHWELLEGLRGKLGHGHQGMAHPGKVRMGMISQEVTLHEERTWDFQWA